MQQTRRRVVITGMSIYTPIGVSLETFWENSLKGKIGYSVYKNEKLCKGKEIVLAKIVEEIRNVASVSKEELGVPAFFALNSAAEAIEDADVDLSQLDRTKVGVCVANAISNTPFCEEVFQESDGNNRGHNIFKKGMFSYIAYEISKYFDVYGTSFVMSTGCTGGIDAIGNSFELIANGQQDLMICGGVEAPISNMTVQSFEAIGALSKGFENNPTKASRPFDKDRNGFVLGEGCGMLILEDYESAVKRNATIYGEICSYASCNNAYHMTDLLNDGEDLVKIIDEAIAEAGIERNHIGYINAHGSSTPQNDSFETEAYKKLFGQYAYDIPISSTKSMTGHSLAAASAIETIHTMMALNHGKIPPTANFSEGSNCDLFYVPNEAIEKEINYALTNANGFSGLHSVLVLSNLTN